MVESFARHLAERFCSLNGWPWGLGCVTAKLGSKGGDTYGERVSPIEVVDLSELLLNTWPMPLVSKGLRELLTSSIHIFEPQLGNFFIIKLNAHRYLVQRSTFVLEILEYYYKIQ